MYIVSTVEDKKKFRILFCRTLMIKKLGGGGEMVRHLLKNSRSVWPCYHFYLSRSLYVSLKEIYTIIYLIKCSRFFVYRLLRRSFSSLKKLKPSFSNLSRRELIVRPLYSIDVFSMLGLPRAYIFYCWRSIGS